MFLKFKDQKRYRVGFKFPWQIIFATDQKEAFSGLNP